MRIYLVRHGQTNYNLKRLVQGRIDEPLNKTGIKQAKQTGQLIKQLNFKFDKIVSSPLSRAFETAYLIAKKNNYKDNIILDNLLVERDFGEYELTEIKESFPIVMQEGFNENGFEDTETLKKRIKSAISNLYLNHSDQTLILTVHAHVIRTIYVLMDENKYTYTNFYLGNCSIHVFDFDGDNFNLIETHNNEEI
ncbi:histidine phosphatase family protein [Haploplasma modicum]|uniref:histidine phosphatase family protein n=1 Tax=Haploplasma modicum TaxID=2150 RepID=UPI00214BA81E|nr:histidine phosphatase family protein [Haploplasma modicum]MCR1808857.1 histidine phosphatase family protein [Haploplasma modicum]